MAKRKVTVLLDARLIDELSDFVEQGWFSTLSDAIESAVRGKLATLKGQRLAEQCKRLNPDVERAFAEAGFTSNLRGWPEY